VVVTIFIPQLTVSVNTWDITFSFGLECLTGNSKRSFQREAIELHSMTESELSSVSLKFILGAFNIP
jgi:hypothetical protein